MSRPDWLGFHRIWLTQGWRTKAHASGEAQVTVEQQESSAQPVDFFEVGSLPTIDRNSR
jgi:hypothetical protein